MMRASESDHYVVTGQPRSGVARLASARRTSGLVLPALLLIAWEIAARQGLSPRFLVSPTEIAWQWWQTAVSGELWRHGQASLRIVTLGFLCGAIAGAAIGLLAGVFRAVESFYEPLVSLTYPIPKVALLPLIFAWFGFGEGSKVLIVMTSVFYPVYIAAYYGAKSVKPVYIWSGQNVGASRASIIWQIIAPAALPQIFAGLRIGLALSFIIMVTSELVVSDRGLGYLIARAEESHRFDLMFVAIATIGAAGFVADRLLIAVRDRALVGQTLGTEAARAE
jgi:ABC-type nitrate/sulfonate/bicarbonate transport system permease component